MEDREKGNQFGFENNYNGINFFILRVRENLNSVCVYNRKSSYYHQLIIFFITLSHTITHTIT